MTIECDVLVVGGGPAGSSAARAAAKEGAKTILVEEHEAIGVPVQCAEGIGKYLIPFLPFKIPKEQLLWEIKGMTFWADDNLIERNGGIWSGYTINRTKWDQWLATLAKNKGAEIKLNSKLTDLEYNDELVVKKAIVKSNNKKIEIEPKIVIAADGVNSTVVELLRIRKESKQDLGEVKSYEIKNINLTYPNHDQLFLGEFAPNAYAYIFPMTKNRANIGIGKVYDEKNNIETLYKNFIETPIVNKQIKNAKIVSEKSGYAPVKYTTNEWIYGNTLLVGDVANQNFKPFIEGNLPAIICGDIAGKISAKNKQNIENLYKYKKNVYKKIGPMFKSSDIVTDMLLEIQELKNKDLLYMILFSNIYSIKTLKKLMKTEEKDEIMQKITSWKEGKINQSKTLLTEASYLILLSIWHQIRRL
jgi:digeranylgeranylglycerophospholipid reductase